MSTSVESAVPFTTCAPLAVPAQLSGSGSALECVSFVGTVLEGVPLSDSLPPAVLATLTPGICKGGNRYYRTIQGGAAGVGRLADPGG